MKSKFHLASIASVLAIAGVALSVTNANARYRGTEPACIADAPRGDTLRVHKHPRRGSRTKGRVSVGACGFNVESIEGDWTYIRGTDHRGRNIEGWVNNRFLSRAGTSAAGGGFPIDAASGGGIVRSGPGMDYRKIASTGQFEPITVLRNTGVVTGGYPWFQIRFRGRRGYQWGGIICSTEQPFEGTFDVCENFRNSLNRNGGGAAVPQDRRVEYECNEGIPLIVTFIDKDGESYALYSHDSGPKNRVTARPTGSGFDYTNGYHELRGKGKNIDLIEGGNVIDSCVSR